jgi:sulfatase modifying factor 1
MKRQLIAVLALTVLVFGMTSCHKKGKSKGLPDNGQLEGVAPTARPSMLKPKGMVYIPPGTFHMGPSDEDVNYNFTARNKQVSINGFWMDATEITNNEYRQFVWWVRDSLAAMALNFFKAGPNGDTAVDWKKMKTVKYSDPKTLEGIADKLILSVNDRLKGRMELDPQKVIFHIEYFDLKEAAKVENKRKPRSNFIVRYDEKVYPDTLVWIRDFSYSYNEPMTKRYFSHPAFGNYPVVGVNWKQATAFCELENTLPEIFLNQRKEHRNQISACLQKHSGNMQHVAAVHNQCSHGVTII